MLEVNTVNQWVTSYAMPWGVNIVLALLIFLVGRIAVKWIIKLLDKVLVRANVDTILINFINAIVHAFDICWASELLLLTRSNSL